MSPFADPARIAAAQRLRAALPARIHRIIDDEADIPPEPTEQRPPRPRPPSWPADVPDPGSRCIVIGGPCRGMLGRVLGFVRNARRGPLISIRADDGRYSRVVAEWVQPEGAPMPDVPMTRRSAGVDGYLPGDRLRITAGPRFGEVVTFVRTAGSQSPGRRTLRILRADGKRGTVLADIARAA